MNPIRRIRRITGTLAGLAFACLVLSVAAPAAFARTVPPAGDWRGVTTPAPPVQVHTVIESGMTGWQIALIAVGAALVAATIAVLLDRARTARLKPLAEGA
jgi:hypothetical protein